jgi:lipid A 3-O-deacylase
LILHDLISHFRTVGLFILLLLFNHPCYAQADPSQGQPRNWDFSVWVAGATGEENTNSFSEAQILSAGVFAGKVLTNEIGRGWRRGRFEYGVDVIPLFRQFRPQSIYGGGFEPVILRWNSSLHADRVAPYIELAGGAVRTNTNLPAGDTSNFNFTARGGGGIQIFTKPHHSVDIGCRWSHISNANLGVRNTEFNGIQVSLGYHWFP